MGSRLGASFDKRIIIHIYWWFATNLPIMEGCDVGCALLERADEKPFYNCISTERDSVNNCPPANFVAPAEVLSTGEK